MNAITFALNHMTAPTMGLDAFLEMAGSLGINSVEIRNDLAGNAIIDGTSAAQVADLAGKHGLTIISINALQRFNEWNAERDAEARSLISYARECGARALVLVPVNDGSSRAEGERRENLRASLRALKPILEENGIVGLVEPLGFGISSLRSKSEAADAIDAVDGQDRFKLVHDTFHHTLAGEPELFADRTGLVHISGVEDASVSIGEMQDSHRCMLGEVDRLDNLGQIRALLRAGYAGPFSFEPFAPSVHANRDPRGMVASSMSFIAKRL